MKTLPVKSIAKFFSQFGELFRWDQYSGNPDFFVQLCFRIYSHDNSVMKKICDLANECPEIQKRRNDILALFPEDILRKPVRYDTHINLRGGQEALRHTGLSDYLDDFQHLRYPDGAFECARIDLGFRCEKYYSIEYLDGVDDRGYVLTIVNEGSKSYRCFVSGVMGVECLEDFDSIMEGAIRSGKFECGESAIFSSFYQDSRQ